MTSDISPSKPPERACNGIAKKTNTTPSHRILRCSVAAVPACCTLLAPHAAGTPRSHPAWFRVARRAPQRTGELHGAGQRRSTIRSSIDAIDKAATSAPFGTQGVCSRRGGGVCVARPHVVSLSSSGPRQREKRARAPNSRTTGSRKTAQAINFASPPEPPPNCGPRVVRGGVLAGPPHRAHGRRLPGHVSNDMASLVSPGWRAQRGGGEH